MLNEVFIYGFSLTENDELIEIANEMGLSVTNIGDDTLPAMSLDQKDILSLSRSQQRMINHTSECQCESLNFLDIFRPSPDVLIEHKAPESDAKTTPEKPSTRRTRPNLAAKKQSRAANITSRMTMRPVPEPQSKNKRSSLLRYAQYATTAAPIHTTKTASISDDDSSDGDARRTVASIVGQYDARLTSGSAGHLVPLRSPRRPWQVGANALTSTAWRLVAYHVTHPPQCQSHPPGPCNPTSTASVTDISRPGNRNPDC